MHGRLRELYPVFRPPANPIPSGKRSPTPSSSDEVSGLQTLFTQRWSYTFMVYRFCAADIAGRGLRPHVRGLSWKVGLRAAGRRRETARIFSRWNSFSSGMGSSTVVTSALIRGFCAKAKVVRFSEIRKMTLKSALEDLLGTTLAGVAGIAGKIEYVASLRDAASGAYSHWG